MMAKHQNPTTHEMSAFT